MSAGPRPTFGEMETFERVSSGSSGEPAQAYRMIVPGGWIYYLERRHGESCAVFVPDTLRVSL